MEISTMISSFSHMLSIKGKLFPEEKTVSNFEDREEFNKKYCSIYMEHSFNPLSIGLNEKEKVILVLAKRSEFTVPILHIDWVIMETKLDSFKPVDYEIPDLLVVSDQGKLFIAKNLQDILGFHVKYLKLKGKKLSKALDTLALQVTYADGHTVKVSAQESLKESLCVLLAKRNNT